MTETAQRCTVTDPDNIRHRLDWNHADWMHRTVCGEKSDLSKGWVGVPTEWTLDCAECWWSA